MKVTKSKKKKKKNCANVLMFSNSPPPPPQKQQHQQEQILKLTRKDELTDWQIEGMNEIKAKNDNKTLDQNKLSTEACSSMQCHPLHIKKKNF